MKSIVAGTPGAVDTKYSTRIPPAQYNDSLGRLGEFDRKLAGEFHTGFADVHREMEDAMTKAKAAFGADYDVCGRDGVHPGPNGHLLIGGGISQGLGLDGDIGDITVDMQGASSASEGHRASGSNGKAEVESSKYPFCFEGDDKSPGGTREHPALLQVQRRAEPADASCEESQCAQGKSDMGRGDEGVHPRAARARRQPRRRVHEDTGRTRPSSIS